MSEAPTRQAVVNFVLYCEALLSHSFKPSDFTEGERNTIAKYLTHMSQSDKPWSKISSAA